jgi:type 1 glutamine amidotransferase
MKNYFILSVIILTAMTGCGEKPQPIRIAFIQGMNPVIDTALYAPVFEDFEGVEWKAYTNEESQTLFKPENSGLYDVIIFHDICLEEIPESTKADIINVISAGKPVFVIHDGLLTYNKWDEFAKIAGMKYFMSEQWVDSVEYGVSTYKHNQEIPVRVIDKAHFITQGISPEFTLHDEIYGKLYQSPEIHPLWITTHPECNQVIMYTHKYGNGKVVGIVPGHGPGIFSDKNYKTAFQRAILWLTEK